MQPFPNSQLKVSLREQANRTSNTNDQASYVKKATITPYQDTTSEPRNHAWVSFSGFRNAPILRPEARMRPPQFETDGKVDILDDMADSDEEEKWTNSHTHLPLLPESSYSSDKGWPSASRPLPKERPSLDGERGAEESAKKGRLISPDHLVSLSRASKNHGRHGGHETARSGPLGVERPDGGGSTSSPAM